MKTGKGMRISTAHDGVVRVLFADGRIRDISAEMPISIWRKLLMGEIKSDAELDHWTPSPDDPAPVNLWINRPPMGKWPFYLSIVVWLISVMLIFHRAWTSRKNGKKPKRPPHNQPCNTASPPSSWSSSSRRHRWR